MNCQFYSIIDIIYIKKIHKRFMFRYVIFILINENFCFGCLMIVIII